MCVGAGTALASTHEAAQGRSGCRRHLRMAMSDVDLLEDMHDHTDEAMPTLRTKFKLFLTCCDLDGRKASQRIVLTAAHWLKVHMHLPFQCQI